MRRRKRSKCRAVGDDCLKAECYCMNYNLPHINKVQTWETCGYREEVVE